MVLKLYGVDGSQPFRTVQWALEAKGVAYETIVVQPGGKREEAPLGTASAAYRKINPLGQVPCLVDTDAKVALGECCAILVYLAEKYGWTDLYPAEPARRALVNQWLHWMHRGSREFTLVLFAPVFRPDIKQNAEELAHRAKGLSATAKLLNAQLERTAFLTGDSATLADLAVYGDLGQLQPKFCDLFDFAPYPHLSRWLKAMEALPKFERCHNVIFAKLRKLVLKSRGKAGAAEGGDSAAAKVDGKGGKGKPTKSSKL
jgi:glutathione S-transferase/autophagy-related protein 2